MGSVGKHICLLLAAGLLLALCLTLSPGRAVETFAPPGAHAELLVLMYHSLVTDETAAAEYVCPITRLESDLLWLRENGYQSVTLSQLTAYADGKGTLPPKPVLLTLDDGYRNNLTLLPPLLEAYDFHAVIGVVGEYADIYTASGEDGSPHSCMSWEDLSRAAAVERIQLACHSYYFHHLTGRQGTAQKPGESIDAWRAALISDTQALLLALEERCGAHPICYAYPFGQITQGADEILRELGFRVTLSCREQRSLLISGDPTCLFSLGRFNRDGRLSTAEFMARIAKEAP